MNVVLLTGATRGIGAAMAAAFAGPDTQLILTGTRPDPAWTAGDNRRYVAVDFSDPEALRRFTAFVAGLDRLDVCVNNAGINIIKPLADVTEEDYDRLQAVDCRAPYLIAKAAAGVMRRRRSGRIVNIASIWSAVTKPGRSLYSTAKTALTGMTRALAAELAPDNILVNCVSPGFTLTDLTRQSLSPGEIEAISRGIPMARMAEPEEIARIVRFLCSEENTYLTGQNIVVDGGFSIV